MSVLYRPHRGGLSEAMSEVSEVETLEDIFKLSELEQWGYFPEDLKIQYYGIDARIAWITYMIYLDDYGILGFTNGLIK